MQIRLSVTSARDMADAAMDGDVAMRADAVVEVDAVVTAAAGTAFSAAAGALRTLAGAPDGHFFAGSAPVRDEMPLGLPPLLDGAALTVGGPGAPTALPGGLELHVVGGPDAGGVHLISPPEPGAGPVLISIGRGADAQVRIEDPDMSRLHAELLVTADWVRLRDVGSTNGTTMNGSSVGEESVLLLPDALVRLGETTLALRVAQRALEAEPDRLGRLRVHTTRRPPVDLPAPRIDLPPKPSNRGLPNARRRAAAAFEQAKAAAETQIAAALNAEAAQRRERHPDLAALLTTAIRPEERLWTRDPEQPGMLDLRLGTARIASRVSVGSGPKTYRPRVSAAPVTVDLASAGVLGLVGPRPQLTALGRSLVAQLAASCAPRDLEIVLLCDGEARAWQWQWQWVRWLPHVIPQDGQDCRALLALTPAQTTARVAELVERLASRQAAKRDAVPRDMTREGTARRTVLVVDPASDLLDVRGMRRLLDEGPEAGIYAIVLASRPAQLPDETGAMVTLSGDVNTRLRLERPDAPALDNIIADLASVEWAERLGRALAPLRETDGFGAPQLPEEARLLALLELDLLTPAKLGARWSARAADPELTAGADDHGAVRVDLTGHHILVGGVSGSGVSETLRSITCAMAAANRPEYLRIALVSGGNGPSLADSAQLPHVDVHLPSDCAADALRQLLDQIEAEVERRAEAATHEPDSANTSGVTGADDATDPSRPRILMVVDGFERHAADHPWFAKGLAAVARDGREHGLHVVVGLTLEDAQAIRLLDSDLSDEAHIRIALRTHGAEESRKLVSLPTAVSVRHDTPGRAHLALPDGRVLPIQIPLISGRMPSSSSSRATVARLPWTDLGSPVPRRAAEPASTSQLGGPTDLALFVETARRAASR